MDDNPGDLVLLEVNLREQGYDFVGVQTAEAALGALEDGHVDCVLVDLGLPGLSGSELCRRIRGSRFAHLPVIVLTGRQGDEALTESLDNGADDHVTKHQEPAVLLARVQAQLRRRQYEEEHQRIRETILLRDAEVREAKAVARAREQLVAQLEAQNQELTEANAALDRLNEELESFAYSVSHDLRQPLRAIGGFVDALRPEIVGKLDATCDHFFDRISSNVVRMNEQIDALLSLSCVARGDLKRTEVDLADLADRVLARLTAGSPARTATVTIARDMPKVWVDRQLIESALENLLGNAWKFTRDTPQASISMYAEQGEGETIIHIRDNGAGFDSRHAERLFTPFQRLHHQRDYAGTGIGLATVQRIIRRHGGRIWADSRPGEGATFSFTVARAGDATTPTE